MKRFVLFTLLLTALATLPARAFYLQEVSEITPINYKTCAFLKSNTPNDEEIAAMGFFSETYPYAPILSPEDLQTTTVFSGVHYDTGQQVKMLWIHADRANLDKGWKNLAKYYVPLSEGETIDQIAEDDERITTFINNLAYISREAIVSVDEFIYDSDGASNTSVNYQGVNLYLSGLAVQFIEGIGRLNSDYPINEYCDNKSVSNSNIYHRTDTWKVTGLVYDVDHDPAPHNAGHAIYGKILDPENHNSPEKGYKIYLCPVETSGDYFYPMLEAKSGVTMYNDNNGCMWKDQNGTIEDFRQKNRAQVIGRWGHYDGSTATDFAIVEFLPDQASGYPNMQKCGFSGNTIVNGAAACQWAPSWDSANGPTRVEYVEGSTIHSPNGYDTLDVTVDSPNQWYGNLQRLTYNTINYLTPGSKQTTESASISADPDEAVTSRWFTIDGRQISAPSVPGIYIEIKGTRAVKRIVR